MMIGTQEIEKKKIFLLLYFKVTTPYTYQSINGGEYYSHCGVNVLIEINKYQADLVDLSHIQLCNKKIHISPE